MLYLQKVLIIYHINVKIQSFFEKGKCLEVVLNTISYSEDLFLSYEDVSLTSNANIHTHKRIVKLDTNGDTVICKIKDITQYQLHENYFSIMDHHVVLQYTISTMDINGYF